MSSKMVTSVEVDKAGTKVRIYHRNPRTEANWTHPYGQDCAVCRGESTAAPEDKYARPKD